MTARRIAAALVSSLWIASALAGCTTPDPDTGGAPAIPFAEEQITRREGDAPSFGPPPGRGSGDGSASAPGMDFAHRLRNGCASDAAVRFTSPPMPLDDITMIAPLGLMVGAHVTPSDHQGYAHPEAPREGGYQVLAVADGDVIAIGLPSEHIVEGDTAPRSYHLLVRHSCTVFTMYFLIEALDPSFDTQAQDLLGGKVQSIPVLAGQPLARITREHGLDFWAGDTSIVLPGFVRPESYASEAWKPHILDPFQFYDEPLRAALEAKAMRAASPRGGKIDHDIDGRLAGNWFLQGTNGYAGLADEPGAQGYWRTHFAAAYDAFDPRLIILSFGDFSGQARQFAVKGNAPDPATLSTESGVVAYELVNFEYFDEATGAPWDRRTLARLQGAANEFVIGTLLVQLVADRELRWELFPGKTAAEIAGFTGAALTYER